jgi:hypothetical protein
MTDATLLEQKAIDHYLNNFVNKTNDALKKIQQVVKGFNENQDLESIQILFDMIKENIILNAEGEIILTNTESFRAYFTDVALESILSQLDIILNP